MMAMLDVKDATQGEGARMLLSKLNGFPFLMNWTNKAETRENEHHPAVEFSFGVSLPVESFLRELSRKVHVRPSP